MAELLFNQLVATQIKCKDCEERRVNVRVCIELQSSSSPVHKKDLIVRLTDDTDPFFLFNLVISDEDFQSLKFQQSLLVDFSAFPQRFIDLLQQCIQEQIKEVPRFLLQLVSSASVLDHTPAFLNVVETNPFKHLTHLSLKLLPGSDTDIKKYLAICLKDIKEEKLLLERKLKKTEDDLGRQLSYTQQTLSEKSRELDRLRSEWTTKAATLTNKHSEELTREKEKALQAHSQWQQQSEQQRKELESLHHKSIQQLQNRLTELELSNKELTERRYKADSTIRELKAKLSGIDDECQRAKQEVQALRRENSALDAECHEKEKHTNQLQTRVAVLEQEIKDKDQLVIRTKEVLDATQEQKMVLETNAEKKQVHTGKLEATIKSLSTELLKANEIIKKLQGEIKILVGKLKLKNTVTVQQEKLLTDKEQQIQREQRVLQDTRQSLQLKEDEVIKLQEVVETTTQKLEESKQLLKTNENVITWLNRQLNENQCAKKQEALGTVANPPTYPNSGTFRTSLSPNHVPENRQYITNSGPNYPSSSAVTFKNSFPQALSTNIVSQHSAYAHATGPKVQLNMPFPRPNAFSPEIQTGLAAATTRTTNKENEAFGLELKYIKKRDDSIPLRGLSQNIINSEQQKSSTTTVAQTSSKNGPPPAPSAYFPGKQ